jgi:hypothetical protein
MPAQFVWHSFYLFCVNLIYIQKKRLWIRPRIPSEMKGEISNALLLNPKCLGTLYYKESATGQCIQVAFDAPGATVSEIVLKNNTGSATPPIKINGEAVTTVTAEEIGIEKNLRIKLASPMTIGPGGMAISVNGMECNTGVCPETKRSLPKFPLAVNNFRIAAGQRIHYTANATGLITMELTGLNGSKIGTIMRERTTPGAHSFVWNGRTIDGKWAGTSIAVLRISSPSGSTAKTVMMNR